MFCSWYIVYRHGIDWREEFQVNDIMFAIREFKAGTKQYKLITQNDEFHQKLSTENSWKI